MKPFLTGHADVLTHVSFDFYGLRMATCAADHTVKVFDRVDDEWRLGDSWRAHEAAVVRTAWAGPEHSQLIATASHDCTVKVWEEDPAEPEQSGKRWRRRATITDYKGPLYDLRFAPSQSGLRLASIASDGVLRIHEALEPNNSTGWSQIAEVSLLNNPVARQLQSSFCLDWCPSVFHQDYLVVCILEDAFVYRREPGGKLERVAELAGHKGLIRDVAWAPSCGRGFQTVATACKDGNLRIFKLLLGSDQTTVELLHESASHDGEVWRLSWNTTGSILTSTGDDCNVKLWKAMNGGRYQCLSVVGVDQK